MSRFRIFGGPNGSGKSTIINSVRSHISNGHLIDFGTYVNADEIALALIEGGFSFKNYQLSGITSDVFRKGVLESGLINDRFPFEEFNASFVLKGGELKLIDERKKVRIAQILANFIIRKLISEEKKCSLETVFSHSSKVDIIRTASDLGYKVYLYFVATEAPEINIARVKYRASQGGHDVPEQTITERYYRSLDLLYAAAQLAYQCYFFDNSGSERKLFAHFKIENGVRKWDPIVEDELPNWFIRYYLNKAQ